MQCNDHYSRTHRIPKYKKMTTTTQDNRNIWMKTNEKNLKTPNGYSDVIEKKWTDNAMTQRLTMIDKTL